MNCKAARVPEITPLWLGADPKLQTPCSHWVYLLVFCWSRLMLERVCAPGPELILTTSFIITLLTITSFFITTTTINTTITTITPSAITTTITIAVIIHTSSIPQSLSPSTTLFHY